MTKTKVGDILWQVLKIVDEAAYKLNRNLIKIKSSNYKDNKKKRKKIWTISKKMQVSKAILVIFSIFLMLAFVNCQRVRGGMQQQQQQQMGGGRWGGQQQQQQQQMGGGRFGGQQQQQQQQMFGSRRG